MRKSRSLISASTAILLLSFLAATPSRAVNFLEDIGLQKAGDSIVVVISTSQPDEFNAFLLDSKPERIVVDLQGVTNSLTQKRFTTLPCKSIESIRTSQYKTSPDLVSRVVLDINRPIDFKSFRKGNDILIKLPVIEGESEFATWQATAKTAAPARQATQVAEQKASAKQATQAAEQKAPAKQATQVAEQKAPAKPKPAASGVQMESFSKRKLVGYGTSSFRDPFVPLIGSFTGQLKGEIPSLENLKLVGILEDSQSSWALLEDSEGNGYMLAPNDRVRNGYLVSVSKNKAVFQVTEYGWTRTVALELKVPELE
jgi:Tfp pilus assembly protein PilP